MCRVTGNYTHLLLLSLSLSLSLSPLSLHFTLSLSLSLRIHAPVDAMDTGPVCTLTHVAFGGEAYVAQADCSLVETGAEWQR